MIKTILFILTISTILIGCSTRKAETSEKSKFIDSLMNEMTLEEKAGQMTLYTSGWDVTGPTLNENYKEELRAGKVGSLFNAHGVKYNTELQRMAVEDTRLGIPLIFGYDVIHGYKTIFPIPLAEAASWNMDLIKRSAELSAKEAAAAGLNWTFNPMVDISRDPRWGRIAEGSGEDTYLGSLIAVAKVKGYQGHDISDALTLMTCVKHFAAYGGAQAGRDYHTVDMSDRVLREIYLPPYKAALDAGAVTIMTSFNEIDGVPASGSKYLMTQILRDEWGFDGFVVTDYTSINEMVSHGIVANEHDAAELAINAGVDMDMQGGVYNKNIIKLIEEEKINEKQIDLAVQRILSAKWDLGLFENPYKYLDTIREERILFSQELMDHSHAVARESIVLLKNEEWKGKQLLPLSKQVKSIAVIGPLADNQIDMLGTWHASGDASKVVTVLQGIKNKIPTANIMFAKGTGFEGDDRKGLQEAINIAKKADVVILALGENHIQSGEAASRTNIDLPGVQNVLVEEMLKLNKSIVALVMAGRPLTIDYLQQNVPSILNTWHLGTMAGEAIADVLFGDYNPSGKITITFPRNVGQIPIYYSMKNTGRPFDANDKYTSKYIDVSNEPLYPFGYGLSYTTFEYTDLLIDRVSISQSETLTAEVTVTNSGNYKGEEVVQLYIQDLVGSVTRPIKELKGFSKIFLEAGESKKVSFTINSDQLKFYDREMNYTTETGDFKVYIGPNSSEGLEGVFTLNNNTEKDNDLIP